jgi:hypothetical protein
MKCFAFTLVLSVAILILSFVRGAPTPHHLRKPIVYPFPTTVGTKWVYKDGTDTVTRVIRQVRSIDETRIVSVVEIDAKMNDCPYAQYWVSGSGVYQLEDHGVKCPTPLRLLKLPFAVGDSWSFDFVGVEYTHRSCNTERLILPAGTFEALIVEWLHPDRKGAKSGRWWFASEVGVVKTEWNHNRREVLVSFSQEP